MVAEHDAPLERTLRMLGVIEDRRLALGIACRNPESLVEIAVIDTSVPADGELVAAHHPLARRGIEAAYQRFEIGVKGTGIDEAP